MRFDGISKAAQVLSEFYFTNKDSLPAEVAEPLGDVIGMTRSPVDAVVITAEVVYAYRDAEGMTDELKALGAACASLAAVHGFHGFDIDSRGDRISLLLRGKSLAASKMPAVDPKYAPPTAAPLEAEPIPRE